MVLHLFSKKYLVQSCCLIKIMYQLSGMLSRSAFKSSVFYKMVSPVCLLLFKSQLNSTTIRNRHMSLWGVLPLPLPCCLCPCQLLGQYTCDPALLRLPLQTGTGGSALAKWQYREDVCLEVYLKLENTIECWKVTSWEHLEHLLCLPDATEDLVIPSWYCSLPRGSKLSLI